jgi:hypothetical protein
MSSAHPDAPYAPYDNNNNAKSKQPPQPFPAMADGRQFTDYRPRCAQERPSEGASCYEIKDTMIRDAERIMERDRTGAAANIGASWCDDPARVPGAELIVNCSDRACAYKETGASEPVGISTDNTRLGI